MTVPFHQRFLFAPEPDVAVAGPPVLPPLPENPYLNEAEVGDEYSTPPAGDGDGLESMAPLAEPKEVDGITPPVEVPRRETKREIATRLEEEAARAKALEASGAELEQKFTAAQKEAEELRKTLKERDDAYVSKVVPLYDANKDEELQSIGKDIGAKLQNTVPFLNSQKAQSIVAGQLPKILEGFAHHLAQGNIAPFRALLEERMFTKEQMEDDPESCAEDIKEVMRLCRETLPSHVKYQETLAKNQESWDTKREANFAEKRKAVDAVFDNVGQWTEDQIKENPTHPQALISGLMKANPKVAGEIKALASAHKEFAAGPAPLPRNPTAQQLANYRAAESRRQSVLDQAAENAFYMTVLPNLAAHLYETNLKLSKRLGTSAPGNRPEASAVAASRESNPVIPAGQDPLSVKNPYL